MFASPAGRRFNGPAASSAPIPRPSLQEPTLNLLSETATPTAPIGYGLALIVVALLLARWWSRHLPAAPDRGTAAGPSLFVVLVTLMTFVLTQAALATWIDIPGEDEPVPRLLCLLRLAMAALALAGLVAAVLHRRQGGRLAGLGYRAQPVGDSLRLALGTYLVIWPLVAGIAILKEAALQAFGLEAGRQFAVETIVDQQALHHDVTFLAGVIVVQPFLEEVLYRGVLMGFLLRHLRPGAAVVVNSLLFAVGHDASLLEVFVLSLALAWLYHRTRSLVAPTLLHVLYNGLNVVILVTSGDVLHDAAS